MADRLVVIGGDAAGMTAASQARRRRNAHDLEIVAFERGPVTSYAACGLPYVVGGTVEDLDALVTRRPEAFRERFAIDARIGHEVVEIDRDRSRVRVRPSDDGGGRGGGDEHWEPYDELVIATGALPRRLDVPGAEAAGIFTVKTLADAAALRTALADGSVARAVVVGGGYIGIEMAEALLLQGVDVALVDVLPQPMATLDPEMGALVADALRTQGVELHLGQGVAGFETSGGRVRAVVMAGGTIEADLVVLGLGVSPNTALAAAAGIPTGPTGALTTDRRMHTPVGGVWAAGDCVESMHRVTGRPVHIALGTHANKQGRVIGINIGGGYASFAGVIGTALTMFHEVEIARTGLTEGEARAAGFEPLATKVTAPTRAGYHPDASSMTVKLVAERGTGRLLGGQIVGGPTAGKRIDTIATAVWNEMTVAEVADLDLGYVPPLAPVWDPVVLAAREAAGGMAHDAAVPRTRPTA